ncbi:ABC transporter permease [Parasporobacterium paucivorans]|uniref:ABC transporter permease n=1 Tax=Parasporobacterium paucivorans TaxID=115544 RepID=UPI001A9A467F|nr:ABC transporter permease [Parasporobacterium paucivorans]
MHIFKTRLKCLLRDKEMLFWSLLFPVALALLFNIAFSNLNAHDTFEPVKLAVVADESYLQDAAFRGALRNVSTGESRIFDLQETELAAARTMLRSNDISGYILAGDVPTLITSGTGLGPSIAKTFLDSYLQMQSSVNSILAKDPSSYEELMDRLNARLSYTKEVSPGGGESNPVLNYFYSLIAMTCFYGAFFGNREVLDVQANLSPLAARISVSPVHKLKSFLYSMCASLLINAAEVLLFILFLAKVLGIDFGEDTGLVVLTALMGSFTGVTFGAFISSLVKKDENVKIGVIIAVSMTGSFLAGMMYGEMKYIVQQNVPVLSYLNPINLLTDAFYCLYYYDTYTRYAVNMGILATFAVVFCLGTYLVIRRRKYAGI